MSKKTKDPRDILIQRIKEALPTGNDVATVGEEEQIALSKNLEDELLKTEIASRLQDIGERKKYADKIFQAVRLWVWAIIAIVVAHDFLSERPPGVISVQAVGRRDSSPDRQHHSKYRRPFYYSGQLPFPQKPKLGHYPINAF